LIREITFKVGRKGFRNNTIAITTTALDDTITAREWAELYFHRWKVELFLRNIKTTMGMDLLKGKAPGMVEKEVFLYFIAYNLIRLLMQEA
jgi:IS4 transposase